MTVAPLTDARLSFKMPTKFVKSFQGSLASKEMRRKKNTVRKRSFPRNKKNVNNEATKYKFHIHTL